MQKFMPKDKKSVVFYFLMSLILLDFGNQAKILSFLPMFQDYSNFIFSITHAYNTGGAFGIMQNSTLFLAIFGLVVSLFLFIYVYKFVNFQEKALLLSLTLLNAGAMGNLIERIKFHHVVDYIKLNFINFPIFNVFDIMICLSVAIYVIFILIDIEEIKKLFKKCK